MGKNNGLLDWLAARADLPGEGIPGQCLVELLGENRVLVEGHRGVREYSPEKIGVTVSFGLLCISGCALELIHMSSDQLVIRGRIDAITVHRRR